MLIFSVYLVIICLLQFHAKNESPFKWKGYQKWTISNIIKEKSIEESILIWSMHVLTLTWFALVLDTDKAYKLLCLGQVRKDKDFSDVFLDIRILEIFKKTGSILGIIQEINFNFA